MSFLAIFCALLQVATAPSASSPIERMRAKIQVESLSALDAARVAGVFKNPGAPLIKKMGGSLNGDSLYLFPDGTYIYTEWGDVSPEAISDKGAWTYSAGLVELASDTDVTWKPGIDRHLIVLRRRSVGDEVLLLELDQVPNFEKNAGGDPDSMLLILAKERYKRLEAAEVPKLKSSLMKNLWNPKARER